MSLFFVDSNCDFDREYIKKLGVECVFMPYSINDKKFELNEEFDYKKFYSKCKKGVIINTPQLSSEEYINIFSKISYHHTSFYSILKTYYQKDKKCQDVFETLIKKKSHNRSCGIVIIEN